MLSLSFETPPGHPRGPVVVVLILDKENWERMKDRDPFDLKLRSLYKYLNIDRPIGDVDLIVAYEDQHEKLYDFWQRQDLSGLMMWLERGHKIIPGDLTAPMPLRKQ